MKSIVFILLILSVLSSCTKSIEKIIYVDSPEIIEGSFPCDGDISRDANFPANQFSYGQLIAKTADSTWRDVPALWDFDNGVINFTSSYSCAKYKILLWR